ncbi:type III secretion system inner membrane ring subunit SctD [Endozoicomonas sp. SCSIO W0465]|uniref:type III secretion system inner membrane ring subunit SctD n=1 Tax=Endozoicomonas sp. SCSIO W0465 TaxID=2918516 RepID=UPI002075C948|nr:type III secretion system inner membrane ring subunit SctD [Endozoicomonas sp. SCSIO W0465]USE39030.1 type III secretion system inner membrane ring subunit SctD [Endozoicomonas sp. SCSIO W0465]
MTEYYLKILSGNHIGAEIPIEPGRYTLGKDDGCDLILTDDNLNAIEFIIEISNDGQIRIQSGTADIPLYLNGEPIGSSIQYRHFDVVTSNGLFIAIGPADAEWPSLALPNVANTPTPQNLPVNEEQHLSPQADEPDLSASDFDQDLPDKEDEDKEDDLDDTSFITSIDKKWLAAIPVVLVLLIVSISLIISNTDNKEQGVTRIPGALEVSTKAKEQLGLKEVKFKLLPDKSLLASGYTQTLQDKLELQKFLRKQGIPFNSQVIVMNEMRDNAEMLLRTQGYDNLELELDNTPGSLVLTGYVSTSDELDSIINMLKQEIYGLISVVDQVENQIDRVNTLKSMLREKGLVPRIHVVVRDQTVILKGHLLDEGQVYDLQTVVSKFQKKYGNKPSIELATKYAGGTLTESQSSLSLNIRGISMGKVPYVILIDGSKYLIGAKLSNGYIIEDINLEYLLLTNGTDKIKYRLGGNRDGQIKK